MRRKVTWLRFIRSDFKEDIRNIISDILIFFIQMTSVQRSTSKPVYFANYTRYIILTVSLIALSIVTSNTLILNFTIICMSDEEEKVFNATEEELRKFFFSGSTVIYL